MQISLIAAVAQNGVIGDGLEMPWHLPADLRYFKAMTQGKIVVMGRKTFDSIGRALPLRQNIVVSRQPRTESEATPAEKAQDSVHWVQSFGDAMHLCEGLLEKGDQLNTPLESDEIMVIGGGQVYKAFLPFASRLYITEVDTQAAGTVRFPAWASTEWRCARTETHQADEKNPHKCVFQLFERVTNGLSYRDLMEGQHDHV